MKHLSIIFPVYNEESRLSKNFQEILKFKKKNLKLKLEIIYVDDGSIDNSHLLIKKFKKKKLNNLSIKYIQLNHNKGKGFAIKKGVSIASGDWILTSDVDLSVPIFQLAIWKKKLILKNNIIFGSRNLIGSKVSAKKYRVFLGHLFKIIIKIILNIYIKDSQCGFKLYKKKFAKKIFSKLTIKGFAHDLEIILISKKYNFEIYEAPVQWKHKDGSKVNFIIDGLDMLLSVLFLKIKYFN